MTNYWPSGLDLTDVQSPMAILREARSDWEEESDGLLTLILQTAESTSGNDMIIVHAKHNPSNRTATLFSVVYRPDIPYPATLLPKDDELPDFLKKHYIKPGISIGLPIEDKTVVNPWVADTPLEFRNNLTEVFNLAIIKSEVLSIVGSAEDAPSAPDEVPIEDPEDRRLGDAEADD